MAMANLHPAAAYEVEVAELRKRSRYALLALGATVLHRVCSMGVAIWQRSLLESIKAGSPPALATLDLSDKAEMAVGIGLLVLLVTTGVTFLRWLKLTVRLTAAFGGGAFKWSPSDAVWGFIIPFVSFVRPYEIIRDVYARLDPELIAEPPLQVVADESTGYRDVRVTPPPPPIRLSRASIGAWWAAWWIGNVLGNISARLGTDDVSSMIGQRAVFATSDVVDVVSAVLAIHVVRAVTLRLLERFRRLRYTPAEKLDAANVVIG